MRAETQEYQPIDVAGTGAPHGQPLHPALTASGFDGAFGRPPEPGAEFDAAIDAVAGRAALAAGVEGFLAGGNSRKPDPVDTDSEETAPDETALEKRGSVETASVESVSAEPPPADATPRPMDAPERGADVGAADQVESAGDADETPGMTRSEALLSLQESMAGRRLLQDIDVRTEPIGSLTALATSARFLADAEKKSSVSYMVFREDGVVELAGQFGAGAAETLGQALEGWGTALESGQVNTKRAFKDLLIKALNITPDQDGPARMVTALSGLIIGELPEIRALGLAPAAEQQLLLLRKNPLLLTRYLLSDEDDLDVFLAGRTREQRQLDQSTEAATSMLGGMLFGRSARNVKDLGGLLNMLASQAGAPESPAGRFARGAGGLVTSVGVSVFTFGVGGVFIGAGQGFYIQKQELEELGIDPNSPAGLRALAQAGLVAGLLEGVQLGRWLRAVPGARTRIGAYLAKVVDDAGTGALTATIDAWNQKLATLKASGREIDAAVLDDLMGDATDTATDGGMAGLLVGRLLEGAHGVAALGQRMAGKKGRTGRPDEDDPPRQIAIARALAAAALKRLSPENLARLARASRQSSVRLMSRFDLPVPPRAVEKELHDLTVKGNLHNQAVNGESDAPDLKLDADDRAGISLAARAEFQALTPAQALDVEGTDAKILSRQNKIDSAKGQNRHRIALLIGKEQYGLILLREFQEELLTRYTALTRQLESVDPADVPAAETAKSLRAALEQAKDSSTPIREFETRLARLERLAGDASAPGRAAAVLAGRPVAEQEFVARTRAGAMRVAGGTAGDVQTIAQAHLARAGLSLPPDGEQLAAAIARLRQTHPDIAAQYAPAIDAALSAEVDARDPAAVTRILDDARALQQLETDLALAERQAPDGDIDPATDQRAENKAPNNESRRETDLLARFDDVLPRPELPSIFVDTTKSEKGTPEYEMLNNPEPNTRYVLDKGTVFVTNDHGYVESISYQPVLNKQTRDSRQTTVGKEGLPDDVGGHIQACALDGTCHRFNLFPQNSKFNNGAYKKWENKIIKALRDEGRTMGRVTTQFYRSNPDFIRPDRLRIVWEMDGNIEEIVFLNREGAGVGD